MGSSFCNTMTKSLRHPFRLLGWSLIALLCCFAIESNAQSNGVVPKPIMLKILKAEDERRWDSDLIELLNHPSATVRERALLAAGRIGDKRAVSAVVSNLEKDKATSVRAMAAFALGEIEVPAATEALVPLVGSQENAEVRARSVEALGKIAAAMPKTEEARGNAAKKAILEVLEFEASRRSAPDEGVILLALTAALRARPDGVGNWIARFLTHGDPRVRADAANALARLRTKDGNEQIRKLLTADSNAIVRANAARVLGATEDKAALSALLDRATTDRDLRVRVSAVRALAALKDPSIAEKLIDFTGGPPKSETPSHRTIDGVNTTNIKNIGELLEIATAVGHLLQGTKNRPAMAWLSELVWVVGNGAPEIPIARVRISPEDYLNNLGADTTTAKRKAQKIILTDWRDASSQAQGLGEIAALPDSTKDKTELSRRAVEVLRGMLDYRNSGLNINTLVAVHSEYAVPDVLRAFAAFKSADLSSVLRKHLNETDAVVRATAAELLGELPPAEENSQALIAALPLALKDQQLNDAALSIIDALGKQKTGAANDAIKTGLKSDDHLIRRRAMAALKANNADDSPDHVAVQTRNRLSDYERALNRVNKFVLATVKTRLGSLTIELRPSEAPLTVDNFVQLAKRGYFNGVTFHRVVANFVIQGGDPRGDGNGGPGYSIRCEINMIPYDRGAVGMALSGKDTGGSQWFVTHSPQPHLDGGYTVFGNVVDGMDVVDSIERGDTILSISINERTKKNRSN